MSKTKPAASEIFTANYLAGPPPCHLHYDAGLEIAYLKQPRQFPLQTVQGYLHNVRQLFLCVSQRPVHQRQFPPLLKSRHVCHHHSYRRRTPLTPTLWYQKTTLPLTVTRTMQLLLKLPRLVWYDVPVREFYLIQMRYPPHRVFQQLGYLAYFHN